MLLEAQGISKRFGRVKALEDVGLNIASNEVFGLVGPNGAGKTTLIRILAGFLKTDSGHLSVLGSNPWRDRSIMSRIGIVPERSNFPKSFTVGDFLARACRIRGIPEGRARGQLELWSLKDASSRPIGALSAGMLQRLALAHALIHEPELVIADEPTSNLDAGGRREVLSHITEDRKGNARAFLVSSHILGDLDRICSRFSFIMGGKLIAQGRLDDLFRESLQDKFRISCEQPDALGQALRSLHPNLEYTLEPRRLVVQVPQAMIDGFLGLLQASAQQAGVQIFSVERVGTSLEEFFHQVTLRTQETT